jgi:hypothetical protein
VTLFLYADVVSVKVLYRVLFRRRGGNRLGFRHVAEPRLRATAQSSSLSSTGQAVDPGVRGGSPGAGQPLPGLSKNELSFFNAAKQVFGETDTVPTGLGPRYNLEGTSKNRDLREFVRI